MTDDHDVSSLLADGVMDGGNVDTEDVSRLPETANTGTLPQIAFALWAYEAGRDMGKTQSLLAERTGMTVPLAQLREWRSRGSWPDIFTTVHQALVGTAAMASRAMLEKAQLDAVSTMIEIMKDKTAGHATRLKAAAMVADRGGNPQMLRAEAISAIHLAANSSYDEMSDDELEAEYTSFNADHYTSDREHKAAAMTTQYIGAALTPR